MILDSNTGKSKGFGFVRFGDEHEHARALTEMQHYRGLGSRPIRVAVATPKGFALKCSDCNAPSCLIYSLKISVGKEERFVHAKPKYAIYSSASSLDLKRLSCTKTSFYHVNLMLSNTTYRSCYILMVLNGNAMSAVCSDGEV